MTTTYTADFIRQKLLTNNSWLIRGLIALYKYQTTDEQSCGVTIHNNGQGFNGVDAPFLSSVAHFAMTGRPLSPKQIAAVRVRLIKYAAQLARIANNA